MLMISPSRFWRMEGSTARVTRRSPMTFVSKMTFAWSVVKASVTPTDAMPALLTSTSIVPASTSTFLTPASTDASSLTSSSTVLMPSLRRASAASRFLPCGRAHRGVDSVAGAVQRLRRVAAEAAASAGDQDGFGHDLRLLE